VAEFARHEERWVRRDGWFDRRWLRFHQPQR
jgi:hypothetical protein